jgi:DNA polymerase II small subunit/DNA polymerase delta subunit B
MSLFDKVWQSVSVVNNILSVSWREQVAFDEMMVMSPLLKTNTPSAN